MNRLWWSCNAHVTRDVENGWQWEWDYLLETPVLLPIYTQLIPKFLISLEYTDSCDCTSGLFYIMALFSLRFFLDLVALFSFYLGHSQCRLYHGVKSYLLPPTMWTWSLNKTWSLIFSTSFFNKYGATLRYTSTGTSIGYNTYRIRGYTLSQKKIH